MSFSATRYYLVLVLSIAIPRILPSYAADNINQEIIIKASIGSGEGQIGYKSYSPGAWVEPSAIAIDSKGNVYVADILNSRIVKFDNKGKYLFNISVTTPLKRANEFTNDITVDYDDNLYVLINNARIIYKYDPHGKLIQTINYETSTVADKIAVTPDGQLYLHHAILSQLSKLNKTGKIENTWNSVTSFITDSEGYLYISKGNGVEEKYNKVGKLLGLIECEKEDLKLIFPVSEGGGCYCPPHYIDRHGNRYFLKKEGQLQPKKVSSILAFDRTGKYKKAVILPFSADIYPQSNLIKFGYDGNFYTETGHPQIEFQVMRIMLD